ncbi:MAG: hypothetical protein CME62_11755 [Halobacteriovoraceae bacterium]|nr:hypothetical protein [Halobacteriovoraceae bacterium]|tara:strand:- start:4040 stop:4408 length:369 start_codon:yes stop_codon:yes gene_type:complete
MFKNLFTLLTLLFTCSLSAQVFYDMNDGNHIVVEGYVDNLKSYSFLLVTKSGESAIRVEVDDDENRANTDALREGDPVMVIGKVDQDQFEKAKIEASKVYIKRIEKFIYADSFDEEDQTFAL